MKVLVCGSRHFDDWNMLNEVLGPYLNDYITKDQDLVIIEGEAKGADFLARVWARYNGVPFEPFPADWKQYGVRAGPIRNAQMLKEGLPDLVIAFMAKNSRGTQNMIDQATKAGVEVKVVEIA